MRQRDVVALVALNPFPPEGHAGRTPAPDTPAPDEALLARVTRTPREKAQPRSGDSAAGDTPLP